MKLLFDQLLQREGGTYRTHEHGDAGELSLVGRSGALEGSDGRGGERGGVGGHLGLAVRDDGDDNDGRWGGAGCDSAGGCGGCHGGDDGYGGGQGGGCHWASGYRRGSGRCCRCGSGSLRRRGRNDEGHTGAEAERLRKLESLCAKTSILRRRAKVERWNGLLARSAWSQTASTVVCRECRNDESLQMHATSVRAQPVELRELMAGVNCGDN